MIRIAQTTSHFAMSLQFLKHWRNAFFQRNGLALLSLLGVLTGIATSTVIAWFMVTIDLVLSLLQSDERPGFESFSVFIRFTLPILGAILLIALLKVAPRKFHDMGITHVIDRLQRGRGKLPIGNALLQFASALIALASGFSMGKEGPAVHVGSGIASKVGRELHRSPSQLRLLTGCGTAAAVSSAFGTPLAGVMFAMEVVLMEYSLLGFIPIIAAAVTGAVATQLLLGEHPAFFQITVGDFTWIDLPWLVLLGIATGIVAAFLHKLIKYFLTLNLVRMEIRFLIAGVVTGFIGIWLPQVMGLGYETMDAIITGQYGILLLSAILVGKVAATGIAVGMGIPAGIVAPSLVIGMATGAVIGYWAPGNANDAVFALIGMAGLMSALLHAPLAALTAVLELSLSAEMMFPAMIVVVLANLTCQVVFLQPSIFQTLLSNKGLNISTHPMRNALASRFLTEIASEQFVVLHKDLETSQIENLIATDHRLAILRFGANSHLVTLHALNRQYEKWTALEHNEDIRLFDYLTKDIPDRSRLAIVTEEVSLLEGLKVLQSDDVVGIQVPLDDFRIGLVTRNKLSSVITSEGDLH